MEGKKKEKSTKDYEIPIGDSYKLFAKKKLGSGAFGDIYKGFSAKLNEEVAIKLVIITANIINVTGAHQSKASSAYFRVQNVFSPSRRWYLIYININKYLLFSGNS